VGVTSRFRPLRILLVEDNPDDLAITRRAFEKTDGATTLVVARDGQEVIEMLEGGGGRPGRPDLVLLDINLPKVNGLDVLAWVRATPMVSRVPIVMLTASGRHEDVNRSYQLGANSYIQKPVVFERLTRALYVVREYWFEVATLPLVS
jgi:two-component system, response regulator